MTNISITILGHIKRKINTKKLQQWKSDLFKVRSVKEIGDINFNNENYWQELSDSKATEMLKSNSEEVIQILITEYSLENNYYMRRIDKNGAIISFFEVGDILQRYNIPIENFILKNIYELVALKEIYSDLPQTKIEIPDIIHEETRGCLFDMNGLKSDIWYTTEKPTLCSQCEAFLASKHVTKDFIKTLKRELKQIRKQFFYRISDFIKLHPIVSIIIGFFVAICPNMAANFLYDFIKFYICKK